MTQGDQYPVAIAFEYEDGTELTAASAVYISIGHIVKPASYVAEQGWTVQLTQRDSYALQGKQPVQYQVWLAGGNCISGTVGEIYIHENQIREVRGT